VALIEELVAAGIPAGPINYPDETLTDEHLIARKMIVELEHPLLGTLRSIGFPVNFSATGPSYRRYPPRLGEHNDELRAAAMAASKTA
jgi:crotonobetainyl-CoA:carnitine CoA-transferase CaiB-like acyl-CoA transferase